MFILGLFVVFFIEITVLFGQITKTNLFDPALQLRKINYTARTSIEYTYDALGNRVVSVTRNNIQVPLLSVTDLQANIKSHKGIFVISIQNNSAGQMIWTATTNTPWLSFSGSNTGIDFGTVTVNYQANTGALRTGTITITAPGATNSPQIITIEQAALEFSNHVWHVATTGNNSTGDGTLNKPFATIQFGIERAAVGDTVLVNEGTFNENIDFKGKDIVVASYYSFNGDTSTIDQTIIKGTGAGSVVLFSNHESNKSVLNGFTITGGNEINTSSKSGGGINIWASTPRLLNLVVKENQANFGGGISIADASPYLYNIHIFNNTATEVSGGISCNNASPIILNSYIHNNTAENGGGITLYNQSNGIISNCLFESNRANKDGGGININGSNPRIINTTIVNNVSPVGAGIHSNDSSPTILNSIVWGNNIYGEGIGALTINYSNISEGWFGTGNISSNPEFTNPGTSDYSLKGISPCINTGIPDTTGLRIGSRDYLGNPRVFGSWIDMGACEFQSYPLPANAGKIIGQTTICQEQIMHLYYVEKIPNATSYVWTLPFGAIGESNTNEIIVGYGTSALSGELKVKGINSHGAGLESVLPVMIHEVPAKPEVTLMNGVLYSSANSGNQWYYNSQMIPDANNPTYIPGKIGDYSVIASTAFCASPPSNSIFIPTNNVDFPETNRIKIFPNPTSGLMDISGIEEMMNDFKIEVYNNNGKRVPYLIKSKSDHRISIDIRRLPVGIYLVKICNKKILFLSKIVKK